MRVIAGKYRGRPLVTPEGLSTRPILDRVKGSLFDWLGSRLAMPGSLPAVNVADLFCGAGSIGIEALSRGAAFCAFVETDRDALASLRQNIEKIGIRTGFVILPRGAEAIAVKPPGGDGFSLVFLDPPFPLSGEIAPDSVMGRVVMRLGQQIPVTADALVLWRHDEHCHLPDTLPGGWTQRERRSWGTNAITLYEQGAGGAR